MIDLLCHLPAKYSKLFHMQLSPYHFRKGCCKNLHVPQFEANTFLGNEYLSAFQVVGWFACLP